MAIGKTKASPPIFEPEMIFKRQSRAEAGFSHPAPSIPAQALRAFGETSEPESDHDQDYGLRPCAIQVG